MPLHRENSFVGGYEVMELGPAVVNTRVRISAAERNGVCVL